MRSGPACHQNWTAALEEDPARSIYEVPLYSDAKMTGEYTKGLGPYQILNGLPASVHDPALVLVVRAHLDPHDFGDMKKTDVTKFSGGSLADEIAALLSLSQGSRLMAGSTTRTQIGNQPRIIGDHSRPVLPTRVVGDLPLLPNATVGRPIDISYLRLLPKLGTDAAIALVRAARSYRDALWLAETEPELAWLLLVSAIEAAAVQHYVDEATPLEILRDSKDELATKLDAIDPRATVLVAEALAREQRAMFRFLKFTSEFAPRPPANRPSPAFQVDWSLRGLKACMKQVYDHRSRALHEAIPFPPPMCHPPHKVILTDDAPTEKPAGSAMATMGGVWLLSESAMLLHTFEYFTRGALLNWWRSLIPTDAGPSD